jgi:ferrochelatase
MSTKQGVLLVSHGTVARIEDLPAFVQNVRQGRPPSAEMIEELRRRYEAIGGSPLNTINANLCGLLQSALNVPVAFGSRFWNPTIRDQVQHLATAGVTQLAVVPLAQHSAQVYEKDVRKAVEGMQAPELVFAPGWGQRPDLAAAFARRIAKALEGHDPRRTTVLMTAHSLPKMVIDRGDSYEREVRASAAAIGALLGDVRWQVVFQSQGISDIPGGWLGPDLPTSLEEVRARGDAGVVLAPIGFLADHVEILYDLDVEAAGIAKGKGLRFTRAASLNADADFIDVLTEVIRPLLAHA